MTRPVPPTPGPSRPTPPHPGPRRTPRPRLTRTLLHVLSALVALTGMVLTFLLARSGHDTAGLVAVLTALVPLLTGLSRTR
ncbi:hypothetical protein [Deinococcus aquiradiocola]|uniref:Uncharacterized protein n=1 Tax=Deinococcus aquiradiocola TaxID=393059 RepID=A0A917PSR8_9DEIO|nr:hypothetical protein [Deinococcus aquiradiocola]GGJ89496.1 hypothetical protein GCM10008939_36850 [Deinococcus aquiradiocola]